VYRLPHRELDLVGAWGGGVRGLGKGPVYLLEGKGGIVLKAFEGEKWGRWGLVREKMVKERFCYFSWV